MTYIKIIRREGPLGGHVDATILYDESPVGVLKSDQAEIQLPLGKTEQTIQAELKDEYGQVFRSNAYFANAKSTTLYLLINGFHMKLMVADPEKK